MSLMLTHVAFTGHSRMGKSRVEVHYNGDDGETICPLAALIPDSVSVHPSYVRDAPLNATQVEQTYMRLPFIAFMEYSVHVFGES